MAMDPIEVCWSSDEAEVRRLVAAGAGGAERRTVGEAEEFSPRRLVLGPALARAVSRSLPVT